MQLGNYEDSPPADFWATFPSFDIPSDIHNYLHRIGRSGRWGRKGMAINFVTRRDVDLLRNIERYYKSTIVELPASIIDKKA